MSGDVDFERTWLEKLSRGVQEVAGEHVCQEIMEGSDALSSDTPRRDVIDWTRQAVDRLVSAVGREEASAVLAGCACQYPVSDLQEARKAYEASGDLVAAHRALQQQFERFLREVLELDEEIIVDITARGWGLAGVIRGTTVIATKIPKSGNLVAYLEETDPKRRRLLYCHCPRIREALRDAKHHWPDATAETYCHCGAGFYKGIWEEILQSPVKVEVLESVLKGDEVCRVAVRLRQAAT